MGIVPSSLHVFVWNDDVCGPHQLPYDGPYKVWQKNPEIYGGRLRGYDANISIDWLKSAYIIANTTPAAVTQ